ncbi:hypothetical protein IX307_002299 [Bacteroides pyogenes]|nr:hypothetical protein [Bacteroides pyogenes]MBR8721080.1 hypothetical protein [Bacteroides pyogenes]MBR8725173.1 hypothetical protein [Bacteroides pyogenes]MBR8738638.1 hypothetical protein [Bacteroides pyogenes]MBR8754380.1 hypothetical protein [Bacteroides pyogenes]
MIKIYNKPLLVKLNSTSVYGIRSVSISYMLIVQEPLALI